MKMKVKIVKQVMLGGTVLFDEGDVTELVSTVLDRDGYFCGVLVGKDGHLRLVYATDFVVERGLNEEHYGSNGGMMMLCENSTTTAQFDIVFNH